MHTLTKTHARHLTLLNRLGRCLAFGCTPHQTLRAASLASRLTRAWPSAFLAAEGYVPPGEVWRVGSGRGDGPDGVREVAEAANRGLLGRVLGEGRFTAVGDDVRVYPVPVSPLPVLPLPLSAQDLLQEMLTSGLTGPKAKTKHHTDLPLPLRRGRITNPPHPLPDPPRLVPRKQVPPDDAVRRLLGGDAARRDGAGGAEGGEHGGWEPGGGREREHRSPGPVPARVRGWGPRGEGGGRGA